ncbi:MAG: SCO family protein [Oscillochloris sp.]|nr:SCO family protein [Oscillochloris sp.]
MRYFMLLVLTSLMLSGCAAFSPEAEPNSLDSGTVIEPPVVLTDFTLPSSLGRDLSLRELQGKPTLLFFGYTFCPDVCPLTLSEFRKVKENLGSDGDAVNYLFISVDGERDTPEVLARYVQNFDPGFVGMQGDEATLRRIGKDYGLFYQKNTPEGTGAAYLVDHSSASYLLDAEGRMRVVYSFGTSPETITEGVQQLLEE